MNRESLFFGGCTNREVVLSERERFALNSSLLSISIVPHHAQPVHQLHRPHLSPSASCTTFCLPLLRLFLTRLVSFIACHIHPPLFRSWSHTHITHCSHQRPFLIASPTLPHRRNFHLDLSRLSLDFCRTVSRRSLRLVPTYPFPCPAQYFALPIIQLSTVCRWPFSSSAVYLSRCDKRSANAPVCTWHTLCARDQWHRLRCSSRWSSVLAILLSLLPLTKIRSHSQLSSKGDIFIKRMHNIQAFDTC